MLGLAANQVVAADVTADGVLRHVDAVPGIYAELARSSDLPA